MSKIYTCKHCGQTFSNLEKPTSFMSNHSRWCELNLKRSSYVETLASRNMTIVMNAARISSGRTNQFTAAKLDGKEVPVSHRKGAKRTNVKPHTPETIEKIRAGALASPHRRLKKNTVLYKGVLLDSSWELALAKRLDELEIEWSRPEPLPWVDKNGLTHNYFPDFYLSKYDLYLDPKNGFAAQVQKNKLTIILERYKNVRILTSLAECQTFTLGMAP